ncbi:MAG: glycosyltransferase family 87 protein [Syntrophomonadaceae bacterium]|nr:glycosyltransferase family 87 protein [Syntrophomonadaceae bacterium]
MINKYIFYIMLLLAGLIITVSIVAYTVGGDFPIFYHVAKIILDPNAPNSQIYDFLTSDQYSIPQTTPCTYYFYSMAASYILAPLALLPYYWAKTLFIFLDFIAYIVAVGIILYNLGAKERWFFYPLALSILWFPFVMDIASGQINSILFLSIVLAVCAANKNKTILAGVILGLAALFKLFPIAIAMVLGLKNWRILAACVATIAISFLIPDSLFWIHSLASRPAGYIPDIYKYLNNLGIYWFWLYSAIVGLITAIVAWRARHVDYFSLASLAIPATFLAAPIIEIYHLTILIFPYYYLLVAMKKDRIYILLLGLSAIAIYCAISILWTVNRVQFAGLLLLWIIALIQTNRLSQEKI